MASGQDSKKEKEKENKCQQENGGAGDVVADFIEDVWQVMTPELLERLRCVLTEDLGLSKKDADEFIQQQREIRRQRICLQKEKRVIKIGIRNQWIKELSRDVANPLASFLVSMLLSNRTPRTKKITEKILERLCDITEEQTTVKSAKTRMQRTLVVIADRMATYFDEAISDIEREMKELCGYVPHCECMERESLATFVSTETYTPSEGDECDLDQMSESELERLLEKEEKKKVSIKEKPDIVSEEEGSEAIETSEEVESKEDSEISPEEDEEEEGDEEAEEEEEDGDESSEVDMEEEIVEEEEDEEKVEEEEEEEEVEEEELEEEGEEEEELEEEEENKGEEDGEEVEEGERDEEGEEDEGREEGEEEEFGKGDEATKPSREPLDILELLIEDIESTPKRDSKTDRQLAVKEIIENRFKELAKNKVDKSLDSIIKFDIDETASIVANWLEKILPSGDIVAKQSLVPSLIEKQGSAFEIREGAGSQYSVHKISSTTVAQKVADVKGIDFPTRRKKLPRSMSPINDKSTKDWADWALEAVKVGEEWGKWLDNALENVEEHLLKDKDTDSSETKRHDNWKNWKDTMEHEAQKWRAEKHKIKGEAYLWNRKLEAGKPDGPEKETKVITY